MRLFVALDVDENIRARIARFLEGVREFASEARWARPQSLHVTLKFIGEKPEEAVAEIKAALQRIETGVIKINFRGYGFFPTPRSPRVFWIGVDGGTTLAALAASVDEKLGLLAIPKEEHAYNAHLTLARGGGAGSPRQSTGDRPNRTFQHLQEKLSALPAPEFGTMAAREFFLYESKLGPGGSQYTKLAAFTLR
jgi:2'-5' RNA ligase